VRNHINHLHAIFKFAYRKKHWILCNPVDGVDRPADPRKSDRIRFLRIEQLEELLRVGAGQADRQRHRPRSLERGAKIRQLRAKGLEWATIGIAMDCSPATAIYLSNCTAEELERNLLALTDRALWLTAAMTGMRQGELLDLPWSEVDWTAEAIRVHHNSSAEGTVKSDGSFRAVPMFDRVAQELERHFQASAYQADGDRVFCHPTKGTRLDRSETTRRFQRALAKAELPALTFHELRHTFGTTMAADPDVSLRELQEWMGHADIKTTQRYTHYSSRAGQAAIVGRAFARATHSLIPSLKVGSTEAHWNLEEPC
jgi:integrase